MGLETAAIMGIGSLAATAGSTVLSFTQAGQQAKLQRQAEADAIRAMEEVKKRLDVNYLRALSIQKEPYEREREAFLSQGAMAMQAGLESDRGAEATAGKVQMAQTEAQAGVRASMGEKLQKIEEKIIEEDIRLNDLKAQVGLEEVAGAQLAARDAQEAKTQAMHQGFEGLTSTIQQGINMIPLFARTGSNDFMNQSAAVGALSQPIPAFKSSLPTAQLPQFASLSGIGG